MNSIKRRVPDSWALSKVDEVYSVVGGGTPSTKVSEYWDGSIPWITSADIEGIRDIRISRYITENAISGSTTNKVPPGTLLVVTRVGLGKIAIASQPICFSQDLQALIQSNELLAAEFTLYFLNYELQILKFEGRGTTISGLTKKQLKDLPFPLPPLNEQHRIVAKIEELFSELEKGVESLKTAREQLKVYRQAVLKAAFEGRLTESWRKEHAGELESASELLARIKAEREARYTAQLAEWQQAVESWEAEGKPGKKPARPRKPKELPPLTPNELADLPDLPEGWGWSKLGYASTGVEYGTSTRSNKEGKCPVLRMGNIQGGRFCWDDLVYTDDEAEIEAYRLCVGNVLFNRTNSPELVGKTAIFKGEREAIFAGYLIRLNQIDSVANGDYATYFLNSQFAKNYGNTVKTDGVNQSNINGVKLSNYPFPYCGIDEQHQIVQEIESRFSVVEKMEQIIEESLQKAEALRQSILKRAFEGKLVPQVENDEPASKLLERIRAGRTQVTRSKRGRKHA